MDKIEYRVRPVTRYMVTRYHEEKLGEGAAATSSGGVATRGEYDNEDVAYAVAYALCRAEHERLGWPPGDERIQYPPQRDPHQVSIVAM
jgi:hypothetical protein